MKYLLFTIFVFILGCGRDVHHSLGGGYYFSGTSSATGRIVLGNSKDPIILDAAVLEYDYDNKYIFAVRVPAVNFKCRISIGASQDVVVNDFFFVDDIEFVLIKKVTAEKVFFKELNALIDFAKNLGYTKKIPFKSDYTEEKLRLLSFSNLNDVDRGLCSQVK